MGLTAALLRAAARRPRVLLVPVPGARDVLWEAEAALDDLGWPRGLSPAGADVLLVCGEPGTELTAALEIAWEGMAEPRARRQVASGPVLPALHEAARELGDEARQRAAAAGRTARLSGAEQDGDTAHGDMDHGDTADGDMEGMDHSGHDMDHGDMDDGDMEGMDHSGHDMDHGDMGGMDMSLPGGLVMADRMADRDGLRLEGLRLALGPLLPHWPAGLRLDVELSGDVLVEVGARVLDARPEHAAAPELEAWQALATLLGAAGWEHPARAARRAVREPSARAAVLRRVRRSRVLPWSLRGLPGPQGRDLAQHLEHLREACDGRAALPRTDPDQLGEALTGLDLGTAAVVVAAFGPGLAREAARA